MDRIREIKKLCERAKQENDYSEPVYGSTSYYLIMEEIPYLLDQLTTMTARAEQAEKERDKAIEDMKSLKSDCPAICKICDKENCEDCLFRDEFRWRGLKKEELREGD